MTKEQAEEIQSWVVKITTRANELEVAKNNYQEANEGLNDALLKAQKKSRGIRKPKGDIYNNFRQQGDE